VKAPDPPHWTPNSCFGAFWTVLLLHELHCKTGRTGAINALVHATKLCRNFHNERTRSTLLDSNSYFGAFQTILLLHKLQCEKGRIGATNALLRVLGRFGLQKFVPRSRVVIFRNERTRSTPLDPKHMF
jgi:hypothetical protein